MPRLNFTSGCPTSLTKDSHSPNSSYTKASVTDSKLLGVKWNKEDDTIALQCPEAGDKPTKRGVLAKLTTPSDLPPTTLQGKQIFHEIRDSKASWDSPIPDDLGMQFQRREGSLPAELTTSRPIARYHREAVGGLRAPRVQGCVDLWNRSCRLLRRASVRRNHPNTGDSQG